MSRPSNTLVPSPVSPCSPAYPLPPCSSSDYGPGVSWPPGVNCCATEARRLDAVAPVAWTNANHGFESSWNHGTSLCASWRYCARTSIRSPCGNDGLPRPSYCQQGRNVSSALEPPGPIAPAWGLCYTL